MLVFSLWELQGTSEVHDIPDIPKLQRFLLSSGLHCANGSLHGRVDLRVSYGVYSPGNCVTGAICGLKWKRKTHTSKEILQPTYYYIYILHVFFRKVPGPGKFASRDCFCKGEFGDFSLKKDLCIPWRTRVSRAPLTDRKLSILDISRMDEGKLKSNKSNQTNQQVNNWQVHFCQLW